MATYAARRLGDMASNAAGIVAIELLAAAQGIDLRRPKRTSPRLAEAHAAIRKVAAFWDVDRSPAPDIAAVKSLVKDGAFRASLPAAVLPGA
jgi:histidine ammonia-lyase